MATCCHQVYVQRLGCDLLNSLAVRKVAGVAFPLAMEMLGELPALQFPPSLLAAAILHAARKAQVRYPASMSPNIPLSWMHFVSTPLTSPLGASGRIESNRMHCTYHAI